MASDVSKSWFAVFNHPHERTRPNGEFYSDDPKKCCEQLRDEWILDEDGNLIAGRTGAWVYCISAAGLKHVHMVLEDEKAMRFTVIKKSYAQGMHFEETKGSKAQAEGYIKKIGKWEEKGEEILHTEVYGEIKGNQGARKDLEAIEEMIRDGKTPSEIMDEKFAWRKYEKMIKDAFYSKRAKETPPKREVKVVWHVGESGSGKSYNYVKMCNDPTVGEDNIYLLTDYEIGGFDGYCAEPILFMDEFKGQMRFQLLLNYLEGYKIQVHARYGNVKALWNEVHITSVYPPEEVYKNMVDNSVRALDSVAQLKRRINTIVYHWKENGEYKELSVSGEDYVDYAWLKRQVELNVETFDELPMEQWVPF